MAGNLQPLVNNQRIVKQDGTPTDYFIRWAQQKQIDIGAGITAQQALEIITRYLADHELQAGSGIQITPSGNVSDSPTIAAEVQAILDQITNVQGSILFRGAADWQALAPGAAGQFLKTNGAGADPAWAAGGGGGGSYSLVSSTTFSSVTNFVFTDLDFTNFNYDIEISASRPSGGASRVDTTLNVGGAGGSPTFYMTETFFVGGFGAGSTPIGTGAGFVRIGTLQNNSTVHLATSVRLRSNDAASILLGSFSSAFWEVGGVFDVGPVVAGTPIASIRINWTANNWTGRAVLYSIAKT